MGKVTALFKSGSNTETNNYRHITVLPTISKIIEKAVHGQIYTFLANRNILTSKQFGFREKLSATTALTHFKDNILKNMVNGQIRGAAFLDLSRAFDTVDHNLILSKL